MVRDLFSVKLRILGIPAFEGVSWLELDPAVEEAEVQDNPTAYVVLVEGAGTFDINGVYRHAEDELYNERPCWVHSDLLGYSIWYSVFDEWRIGYWVWNSFGFPYYRSDAWGEVPPADGWRAAECGWCGTCPRNPSPTLSFRRDWNVEPDVP